MKLAHSLAEAENFIFAELGTSIRMATPLGLGKPNQLINAIYDRAQKNEQINLSIFTALSLNFNPPQSDMEERFLGPFYKRHFGENYPQLKYVADQKKNQLPKNVKIHEFYFQAGDMVRTGQAQQSYISLNYTHVAKTIFDKDINVIVQMVAASPDGTKISLSSNPDLTLDVVDLYKKAQKKLILVAVIHPDLPYLGGDAEVESSFFDMLVQTNEVNHQLFGLPKVSVDEAEHLIGFFASELIVDDGTLQIGIGSLSDALVNAMVLRQEKNGVYKKMSDELWQGRPRPGKDILHQAVLEKGLYGTSELLMDGFMHLRKAGILKREICDHEEAAKRYLHGAFCLGSKDFYKWLKDLSGKDYEGLSMTRVSKVNDLYDAHEMALRKQRKHARFFNTCMNMTLLGEAASDTLEDGKVVSGVGGQYNFVAMAHELDDAKSVLMLRSTKLKGKKKISNIVESHGHITIPRHLRDIVITEYGIAFLKGASDEQVMQRLIEITDSDFQEELVQKAKKSGKLSQDYEVPEYAKENNLEKIKAFIGKYRKEFPLFPFGSDYTPEEIKLGKALKILKDQDPLDKVISILKGCTANKEKHQAELERMNLAKPKNLSEFLYQKALLGTL